MNTPTTLYDILEVSESASPEIIKAAYLTLAKKYHPDIYSGSSANADEIMKVINSAYATLSDPEKRKHYDWYLQAKRKQTGDEHSNNPQTRQNDITSNVSIPKKVIKKKSGTSTGRIIIRFIVIILIIAIAIVICTNHDTSQQTPIPQLTAQPEPQTGEILSGESGYGSTITVKASKSTACVVKLKNMANKTVLSFYVRAGQTATVDVPSGACYVYFASGKTWYGKHYLFGSDTYYSMDKDCLDFITHSWEYELQEVANGNFSETPISADKFN